MPPIKKLKRIHLKNVEKQNLSASTKGELSVSSVENETWFSILPVDVLLCIYQYLTSAEIAAISQLSDPNLSEAADMQKMANFSVSRRANFELMSSYFTQSRGTYIQKLNFNFYIFAKPTELVKIICMCKNLKVLSVIECGIRYVHVLKILRNCLSLKELSWNIKEPVTSGADFYRCSVTKLFLLYNFPYNGITTLINIFKNFPNIENAVVCLAQDSLIAPPFIGSWSRSLTLSSYDFLRSITVMENFLDQHDEKILRSIIQSNQELRQLWMLSLHSEKDFKQFTRESYNSPPFLKVKPHEQDIETLSSSCSSTYSSLLIFLTVATMDVYERFFKCLPKVVGYELKHLSIEDEHFNMCSINETDNQIPREFYQKISVMLGTLLLNCKNLTVLNFGVTHFRGGSPFKAMCHLKSLKVLCVPTCAFPPECSHSSEENYQQTESQHTDFEEFALECCKVEDFHLVCCSSNRFTMKETALFPVQHWNKLISFSIYRVFFRTCQFLKLVVDFCPDLQSFSLMETCRHSGCIYYNDVIYLLRNAKKLSFIRINDKSFNPLFGCFMHALSSATNLEGICFMTQLKTSYTSTAFLPTLRNLKFLHLFHFSAPGASEQLYVQVKRLMVKNGIKNIKVEKDCLVQSYIGGSNVEFCVGIRDNFFHYQPFFSCRYLHLRKFLFDNYTFFDKD